ncbi:MAG: DUF4920 domain-containing protein [Thermodesulfobacteriota bacterium]
MSVCRHGLLVLFCGWLLLASGAAAAELYGRPLTLVEETRISTILAAPKAYVGKEVLVRGVVIDVCSRRGCWLELAGDAPGQKIQVKVTDGEIVFPMEARGRQALVQGLVEELSLTLEETVRWHRHLAEEEGRPFDERSVTAPETIYRIRGLGARIES